MWNCIEIVAGLPHGYPINPNQSSFSSFGYIRIPLTSFRFPGRFSTLFLVHVFVSKNPEIPTHSSHHSCRPLQAPEPSQIWRLVHRSGVAQRFQWPSRHRLASPPSKVVALAGLIWCRNHKKSSVKNFAPEEKVHWNKNLSWRKYTAASVYVLESKRNGWTLEGEKSRFGFKNCRPLGGSSLPPHFPQANLLNCRTARKLQWQESLKTNSEDYDTRGLFRKVRSLCEYWSLSWKQASQWSDNCIYTSSRFFRNCKSRQKWLCPSRPIRLSACRYANPIRRPPTPCQRTEKLRAKAQISQLAPNQPKPLRDCKENYLVQLFDQSLHHLNQNYQALLHQNQVPSCSLPSLPPQSSTYATCHVRIWLNTFSPSHKQTSRRGWDAWSTIGIRFRCSRCVKAMAWSIYFQLEANRPGQTPRHLRYRHQRLKKWHPNLFSPGTLGA